MLRAHGVATVCREAMCPNQAECWRDRTATFMIGGTTCTRGCRFCAVRKHPRPAGLDASEPERVAAAAKALGARFVVVTSVDRDDLADQGASHWANTIRALRAELPEAGIEALVPDFRGRRDLVDAVLDAAPDVLSHNLETVPRLYDRIRGRARPEWSLAVLSRASERGFIVKTGLMLGLGESDDEVIEHLAEARAAGVDIVTVGQYLQPTPRQARVERYASPADFERIGTAIRALGFAHVESGPLVRSSYHAWRHWRGAQS